MRMPEGSSGGRVSKGIAVAVDRDAGGVQHLLGHLAGQAARGHVHQQQMIVRAAGDETELPPPQLVGQRAGVGDGLSGVGAEGWLQRLAESDRLGGDDVHQRAALHAGKNR